MRIAPSQATRWTCRLVLVLAVVALYLGLRSLTFLRVSEDDWSSPGSPPGTLVLVRTLEEDGGDLVEGALYFCLYRWPTESDPEALSLRLLRVVGLPGETVEVEPGGVKVGGRPVRLPPDRVLDWPARIPDDQCLALTDVTELPPSRPLHPDSRELGPIDVEDLQYRVVASLAF